jgi:hypothetical protein
MVDDYRAKRWFGAKLRPIRGELIYIEHELNCAKSEEFTFKLE